MTREEKLYSMTMKCLVEVAEAEGIKIDKKGSKQKAVEKILAYEAAAVEVREEEQMALAENAPESTENAFNDDVCSDGTIYTEVMQEIVSGAELKAQKAKKERKQRQKKEQTADVIALLDYIMTEWQNMGGNVKMPGKENALFRPLCVDNGRQVIKLMWTAKKISLFVRVEAATAHAEQWQKINYAMPFQCMFFHDTEETRQNIKDIFQIVLDVDSIRPKKEKKAKKETE